MLDSENEKEKEDINLANQSLDSSSPPPIFPTLDIYSLLASISHPNTPHLTIMQEYKLLFLPESAATKKG